MQPQSADPPKKTHSNDLWSEDDIYTNERDCIRTCFAKYLRNPLTLKNKDIVV